MYTWEQLRNVTGRCVTVTQEERNSSTVKISEKKRKNVRQSIQRNYENGSTIN